MASIEEVCESEYNMYRRDGYLGPSNQQRREEGGYTRWEEEEEEWRREEEEELLRWSQQNQYRENQGGMNHSSAAPYRGMPGRGRRGGFHARDRDEFQGADQEVHPVGGKRSMEECDLNPIEKDSMNKLLKRNQQGRDSWTDRQDHGFPGHTQTEQDGGGAEILCLNCGTAGHYQAACNNPPLSPLNEGLVLCGHGFPGASFHRINSPVSQQRDEQKSNDVLGIVSVTEGNGSAAAIERELRYLFPDKKAWKVKELGACEFLVLFPDEDTRRQLTRFRCFGF